MAVAAQRTLLPLDTFAKIMGIQPAFFNQVVVPGSTKPSGNPASIFLQYSWQGNDRMGREELAQCIADAEQSIIEELNYAPGPSWAVNEFHRVTQPANPSLVASWQYAANGQNLAYKMNYGYFKQGGLETWDLLQRGVAVSYSQQFSSVYNDLATITFSVGAGNPDGWLPSEVAIMYPDQGPADSGPYAGDGYEIRPLNVTIDDTTGLVTVTGPSVQFMLWSLLNAAPADDAAIDGTPIGGGGADDPALDDVDIYRHWTDPSQQATLRWEPTGYLGNWGYGWYFGSCSCSEVSSGGLCVACQYSATTGCLQMRNSRLGLATVSPAEWSATDSSFVSTGWPCGPGRLPDQLLVNYKHGLEDRNGGMPADWQRAIAELAASKTVRPLSANNQMEPFSRYWSEDLALVWSQPGGTNSRYNVTNSVLDNPLGTTRGAQRVWRMIQRNKLGQAVAGL